MSVFVLLLITNSLRAQGNYSLCNYLATITGTSNIHTWNERVWKIWGNGDIKQNTDKSFTLLSMKIVMLVKSIKCDEYPIMNGSTHKALKADKFPEIVFVLDESVDNVSYAATPYPVMAKGRLTIGGVTRGVIMPIRVSFYEDKKMTVDVEQQVKMTDYGITPPTALFGLIKTGNLISINFRTTFLADE